MVRPKAPDKAPAPAAAHAPPPQGGAELPEGFRAAVFTPFTGDLDQMVKRRMVRVGVTYNRTFYFVDGGVQRGVTYEFGKAFEDALNQTLKAKGEVSADRERPVDRMPRAHRETLAAAG